MVTPWWNRIGSIIAYPLSRSGAVALAILAVIDCLAFLSNFSPFKLVSIVFTTGLTAAILFQVVRRSAEGSEEFPATSDVEDVFDDVIAPGIKVLVLILVLYLPSVFCGMKGAITMLTAAEKGVWAYADSVTNSVPVGAETAVGVDAAKTALVAGGWFALAGWLALLSSVVFPLALLILAMSRSVLAAMWPGAWLMTLGRVGLSYAGLLVGLFVLGSIFSLVRIPLLLLAVVVPVVPLLVASLVKMYLAICAAHMMGWFVWQNRERLGLGEEQRRDVSIAEVRAMTLARHPQARALMPEPSVVARLEEEFGKALAVGEPQGAVEAAGSLMDAYWAQGRTELVHAMFRRLLALAPDVSLNPERQYRLASELETTNDPTLALTAWRALALRHPDSPLAPEALQRCVLKCREMGRLDWAESASRVLRERYPRHAAAAPAIPAAVPVSSSSSSSSYAPMVPRAAVLPATQRPKGPAAKPVPFVAIAPTEGTTVKTVVLRSAGAALLLYGILWMRLVFIDASFRDKMATVPAESFGNDATGIALKILAVAKAQKIPLEPSGLTVDVGGDSALGPLVKIEARYSRLFPYRSTVTKLELRCNNLREMTSYPALSPRSSPPSPSGR